MRSWLILCASLSCFGPAFADAPKTSIRPLLRPITAQPVITQPVITQPEGAGAALPPVVAPLPATARLRPQHRPSVPPDTVDAVDVVSAVPARKGVLGLLAPRAKPAKRAATSRKGSVCGVPSIKGKTLPRITSKTKGCGIEDPVSVTSVDGAKLSTPATIDCPTAIALNTWVQKGLRPAFPSSEVASLSVVDSYSCRPRNNIRGNKISEHGKGHAIDIAGVTFTNGKTLTVSRNFKSLRRAYKAGCGVFGTTLGPGSDGYHEDHMHFDTARQRGGGAYCR